MPDISFYFNDKRFLGNPGIAATNNLYENYQKNIGPGTD